MADKLEGIVRNRGLGAHMRVDTGHDRGFRPRRHSGGWEQGSGSGFSAVSSTKMPPKGDTSSGSWRVAASPFKVEDQAGKPKLVKEQPKSSQKQKAVLRLNKGKGILVPGEDKKLPLHQAMPRAKGIIIKEAGDAPRAVAEGLRAQITTGRNGTGKGKAALGTEESEKQEDPEEITSPLKEAELVEGKKSDADQPDTETDGSQAAEIEGETVGMICQESATLIEDGGRRPGKRANEGVTREEGQGHKKAKTIKDGTVVRDCPKPPPRP